MASCSFGRDDGGHGVSADRTAGIGGSTYSSNSEALGVFSLEPAVNGAISD